MSVGIDAGSNQMVNRLIHKLNRERISASGRQFSLRTTATPLRAENVIASSTHRMRRQIERMVKSRSESTTPIGSCCVKPMWFADAALTFIAIVWSGHERQSSTQFEIPSMARVISTRESVAAYLPRTGSRDHEPPSPESDQSRSTIRKAPGCIARLDSFKSSDRRHVGTDPPLR